ncbi:MAG: N-acetyltransferase [Allomuricauda sp.]|nr:MAG: N-acetyltransferase [Allomuricauda sp.]
MATDKHLLLDGESTNRLLFRKIVPEDFDLWLPFFDHPEATKYWDGIPTVPRVACTEQFERIFERYENAMGGMNALILKDTNELVGICGLLIQEVDAAEELEIGYSVLPKYWRKGFAFEAAQKCKQYAFENKLSDSLISIIHVDNLPSRKVAMKNGMHLDKKTRYKNNPVDIFRVARTSL